MKLLKIVITVLILLIIIFFIKEYIAHKVAMPFNYDFTIK